MYRFTLFPVFLLALVLATISCLDEIGPKQTEPLSGPDHTSKPYARYWWFASVMKKSDIRYNLDWLKENGFGGVEIAWVYPLNRMNPEDSSYTPRQAWLSTAWQEVVQYAMEYADSIGLGCDLTMGTLWPFGDSYVPFEQAGRKWGDTGWRQEITASWEYPDKGYVIDHLAEESYLPYFRRMLDSFPRPAMKIPTAYFIDSWEVETRHLWTDGFEKEFIAKYAYDITPFMDSIYQPVNQDRLYDYMKLLSEKVVDFYRCYDSVLNAAGIVSRGQCSGAPCDIISAYACLDIPEGEALLYEPEYNSIPASAALLSGKRSVTAETFTCLYGWPRDYLRREQIADLKLLADALFANGVNHIIWHGKPHNPGGFDTISFYATVHTGPEGALAAEIPAFNRYMEKVSAYLKRGRTWSDVAVYLPTEDAWTRGEMPREKQFRWAWAYYEMRYVYFPEELKGYHPIWINGRFLSEGRVVNGRLQCGDASFGLLYADALRLDMENLKRIYELAGQGLPVVMKQIPQQAGFTKQAGWDEMLKELLSMDHVTTSFTAHHEALLEAAQIPPYWCRYDNNALYLFMAHPMAERLSFPLGYGQSLCTDTLSIPMVVNFGGDAINITAVFEPYQSLLYKIEGGRAEEIDIRFVPSVPIVEKRPEGYTPPWLAHHD